jgi:hypothetical protein
MHVTRTRHAIRAVVVAAALTGTLLAGPTARAAQVFGTAPNLTVPTPVSEIFARPADFVGKVVKVQGMIVDVCAARGCWLELGGDKPFQTIRVKVQDGVIVFPLSARGKRAAVQGTLESISMSAEEARRFREHQALEKGVAFDQQSATGPLTLYQIKPTGVLVE